MKEELAKQTKMKKLTQETPKVVQKQGRVMSWDEIVEHGLPEITDEEYARLLDIAKEIEKHFDDTGEQAKQKDYSEDIALFEKLIFPHSESAFLSETSYGSISVIAKGAKILSEINITDLEKSVDDNIK